VVDRRLKVHRNHVQWKMLDSVPRIYATLDSKKEDYYAYIIGMDGNFCDQVVSILIDLGSNYNYVNPDLVYKCGFTEEVHVESMLVQLAIGTKKRFHHWIRACTFELNAMPTLAHLNVLSLDHIVCFWVWTGCIFTGLRWIVMTKLLNAWMKMENREPYGVRRRKHQLGW